MKLDFKLKESITIEANVANIEKPVSLFEDFLSNFEISNQDKMLWSLSLTEVLSNAICHGSKEKGDTIEVSWAYEGKKIKVVVIDKGAGPRAELIESPSLPNDLVAESGRGLFIINSFVDVWLHRRSSEGYSQTLVKLVR